MQFQILSLLSLAAYVIAEDVTVTETTDVDTPVSTVTSLTTECDETVTDCPYRSQETTVAEEEATTAVEETNSTTTEGNITYSLTSWEGAAAGTYAKAGVAVAAGVAALLL